jgi:tetratricopeptide (TPR) repeat protein
MRSAWWVFSVFVLGCGGAPALQGSAPAGESPSRRERNASPSDLHAKGVRLIEQGKLEEAEALLARALDADPTFVPAYWDRGRARLRRGNREGARQDLDRWLEYDPKYALVRADMDLFIFEDGRRARRDAEETDAKRAEQEGSWLAAFRRYAVAYALSLQEEGEGDLADGLIRCWKKANPRPSYPPGLKFYLAQAQLLAGQQRHEDAASVYRLAARFCPWCAEAHFNQAMILGEYQRYAQAVPALKRALELLPDGPEYDEAQGALLTWELLGM